MRFSRIKAVYIDNLVKTNDIIVFDALLKQDNFIEKMEIFGYIANDSGKWPIYIKHEENKGNIYWGTELDPETNKSEFSTTHINIFNKRLYIGQYITYSAINKNNRRDTYRITDIRDWKDYCRN